MSCFVALSQMSVWFWYLMLMTIWTFLSSVNNQMFHCLWNHLIDFPILIQSIHADAFPPRSLWCRVWMRTILLSGKQARLFLGNWAFLRKERQLRCFSHRADGPRSHSEKLYARKKVSNKTFGIMGMSDWRISNEGKSNVSCKRQKIEMPLVFRLSWV